MPASVVGIPVFFVNFRFSFVMPRNSFQLKRTERPGMPVLVYFLEEERLVDEVLRVVLFLVVDFFVVDFLVADLVVDFAASNCSYGMFVVSRIDMSKS